MHDRARVKRVLQGDKAEGERLVSENYPRIYRLLRNLTSSVDVAEDLTQQTFSKAWQALGAYRGEAQFATWLHRIAYHEYTHWLRSRREHVALEEASEIADLRAIVGLKSVLLRRALEQLPDELRDTFVLFYVQELSVYEVAAVLDLPPGTVKSRLFTARQRLRQLLQDPITDEGPQRPKPVPSTFIEKEALSNGLSAPQTQRQAH